MTTTDELNAREIERFQQRLSERVRPQDMDLTPTQPEPLDPRRGEERIADNE